MGLLALAANAVGGATGIGALSALGGAFGGTMADQWKEFFTCDSIPDDTLIVKGRKRTGRRSANTKGSDSVITKGSIVAVADGQCMLIVDDGKVVEFCAQSGAYTYDSSTSPSLFAGSLGQGIINTFNEIGKRFTFGGEPPKDQRVYFVNTRDLIARKYGTSTPIGFMIDDDRRGIHLAVDIRCFGTYSYHVVDPILLYKKLAGNIGEEGYKCNLIDEELRNDLLQALQPAIGKLSGIPYDKIPLHSKEIAEALKEELSSSQSWHDYGIEIVKFTVASVSLDEKDKETVKNAYRDANYGGNAQMGIGGILYNSGAAMTAAANNANGAVNGFMGMGMAGGMGGGMGVAAMQQLNAMNQQPAAFQQPNGYSLGGAPQQPAPAHPAAEQPAQQAKQFAANAGWKCPKCGASATGKFCPECGTPKPAETTGWTCSCGAVNKGKFCSECGKPKPAGVPLYRCDKCGWEPDDPTHPPKFCPECGDPFNEGDIVGTK